MISLLLVVGGLLLLGYSLWSRHGGSRAARHWIDAPPAENWMLERIVLLGAPVAGLALFAIAAIVTFQDIPPLRNLAIGMLALLLLPALYFMIALIPLPLALYPTWARDVVRWRREYWRNLRARRG